MKNLETIQRLARRVLLGAIERYDSFSLNDYKALNKLLYGIETFGVTPIPFVYFGISYDYGNWAEQYVIRYDDDGNFLWFGMEGIERSGMGSDSYEREYLKVYFDDAAIACKTGKELDLDKIEEWHDQVMEMQSLDTINYTLEYYFLD